MKRNLPLQSFLYTGRMLAGLLLAVVAWSPLPAQIGNQTGIEAGTPVSHAGEGHTGSPPMGRQTQLQLLPAAFAGEPRRGDIVNQPTPADVDSAHVAVLKEDGFEGASRAVYAGPGATNWLVEVLRFGDATGAYSAFTFYRNPDMRLEQVGDDAAAGPQLFLARVSASLVMVRPAGTALAAGQDAQTLGAAMKALVGGLPRRHGPDAIPPILPQLMPAAGLDRLSLHYAIGPAGYNGPLPVSVVDFGRDAEAATAAYHLPGAGNAVLTLIMLPTPQIAVAGQQAIGSLPDASLHVAVRRMGPLLAAVSGAGLPKTEADKLLGEIRYRNDITLDQPQGYTSEVAKAARLLVGIAWLTIVLGLAALVIGVFLGFGRVLIRRLQGKPASSLHDEEFITLKL